MKVVGIEKIESFTKRHADSRSPTNSWRLEAEEAQWKTPHDIKRRYPDASVLADNRIVFNIKGNKYRIDVKLSYQHQTVLIIRMGTHKEYSRWKF